MRQSYRRRLWLLVPYVVLTAACWWSIRLLEWPRYKNRLESPAVLAMQHYDAQVQAEVDAIWRRIEAGLRKHGVSYVERLGPPGSDEELAELEFKLGYRLPGDLRASLKVHNGSGGAFIGLNELRNAEWIDRVCSEMVDIQAGVQQEPLDPESMPSYSWHPGWIAVGGWDVYQILVHVETGAVYYFDEANAEWQTISWMQWLENVATRLESGEFVLDESGNWVDGSPGPVPGMRKYYTPGSEYEAQWQ